MDFFDLFSKNLDGICQKIFQVAISQFTKNYHVLFQPSCLAHAKQVFSHGRSECQGPVIAKSAKPTQLNTAPTATSVCPVFANLLNKQNSICPTALQFLRSCWIRMSWRECYSFIDVIVKLCRPKMHEPTTYSKHVASERWWSDRTCTILHYH